MRAAAIFVAAVLMVSTTAFAQVEVTPTQSVPEATDSTTGVAETPPAEEAPSDGSFVQQTQTSDDPVICRTSAATGSRLSRRTTRVCRTRSEWESMQDRNSAEMRQAGQTAIVRNQ